MDQCIPEHIDRNARSAIEKLGTSVLSWALSLNRTSKLGFVRWVRHLPTPHRGSTDILMATQFCRVDRWLWAVRVFRSRASSKEACDRGAVRINDVPAKPASKVRVGDRVIVRVKSQKRELEVKELLEKRVSATLASECYYDHTPVRQQTPASISRVHVAKRDRGAGRPTKRDRRPIPRPKKVPCQR